MRVWAIQSVPLGFKAQMEVRLARHVLLIHTSRSQVIRGARRARLILPRLLGPQPRLLACAGQTFTVMAQPGRALLAHMERHPLLDL